MLREAKTSTHISLSDSTVVVVVVRHALIVKLIGVNHGRLMLVCIVTVANSVTLIL